VRKPIRILIGKVGLDGHDRGSRVVAQALKDAGMEVIFTGIRQTPASITRAALEEDVRAVGLSSLSGAHRTLFPDVARRLRKAGRRILLFGGGVIPPEDEPALKRAGFKAIFPPGTPLDTIVAFVKTHAR
jgi:methylmalonyl-CoA mutase C-terminal domain/subunit